MSKVAGGIPKDYYSTESNQIRLVGAVNGSHGDAELLEKLCTFWGCKKAEAVRTCIRIAASHLPLS